MAKTKYKPDTFVVVPSKYRLMKVDAIAQSVFFWLCSYADNTTGECFPSISTLAKLCKVSRTTIKNRIKKLEQAGLVKKTVRKIPDGKNITNLYQIIADNWSPNADSRGRSANASYRAVADWLRER
jgi:DNA replication protein DnaD